MKASLSACRLQAIAVSRPQESIDQPIRCGVDPNHRYVVDAAVAARMEAQGWVREGIAFCMPPATPRRLGIEETV